MHEAIGTPGNAVDVGGGAVRLSQRAQILGRGLEQGALRIEHVQEAEFAEFKTRGGSVIRTLRARQDFRLEEFGFSTRTAQTGIRLSQLALQPHHGGRQLILRLIGAASSFLYIALITVE